jgi:hypothetical protein
MLKRQKRWGAAGAAIVLVGATVMLLRHRHHAAQPAPAQSNDDFDAPVAARDRWQGFAAGHDVTHAPVDAGSMLANPFSTEVTPDQVGSAMVEWRQAIGEKRAERVLALDRAFSLLPGRYGPALAKVAESDDDERVRAFSTRVLGKMKNVALVDDFGRLLRDKSPFVRQNAAWALGELADRPGGKEAAEVAFDELRHAQDADGATEVRAAATNALEALQ